MYFILLYDYVENMAERRAPVRPSHLERVRDFAGRGLLRMAGAWADPLDGAALVFRAPSRAEVEEFVAGDPYVTSGLVTRWRIREWALVLGAEESAP